MSIRRKLRLVRRHHRLLFKTLVLLARFRISLTFGSYPAIARSIRLSPSPDIERMPALLFAWATRHVAKIVPGATCLTQALTLQSLLAAQGDRAVIRVGVRIESGDTLDAHAWVIFEGQILIGGTDVTLSEYRRLVDLEPSMA